MCSVTRELSQRTATRFSRRLELSDCSKSNECARFASCVSAGRLENIWCGKDRPFKTLVRTAPPQRFTNRACMKLTVYCGFGRIGYQRFTKYYHQDAPDSSAIENCLEHASWCVVPRDKMNDYHYTKQACEWLKAAISPRLVPLNKKPPQQKKSPLGEKSPLRAPPRVHPNLRRRPGGRTLTASALNETTEALETRDPITATALGAMEPFLIMVT